MEGKGIWDFDRSALQISPEEAVIHLSPMETKTYDFRLKVLRSPVSLASLPRLQFSLTGVGRHVRFFRELLFLEQMQVSVRRPPPILDGSLNDLGGVSVLHLDSGSDAQILATHDAISLYLAIVVPLRKATEEEDESAFPDDLQIGIARRTHPGGFGGDAVRLGLAWVDGRCVCRDRMSGRSWDRPLAAVRSACRRSDHEAVYEMEVPLSMLKASKAGEGNRLIVNLSFPVSEPDEQVEGRGTPQQNSFAYQVRYGSDSLVPVHFLELVLDPAPKPSRGSL